MGVLVTVAIASYNNSPYIERCLESVIGQTYNNIEILIVDDGSKDDSLGKIEKYRSNKRVHIVTKENGGLSSVRQLCLELAKGEYISFIDADDYLSPGYVESMILKMQKDDSDICVCGTRFETADGVYLKDVSSFWESKESSLPYVTTPSFLSGYNSKDFLKLHLSDSWNKMYKVSTIRRCRVKFNMPKGLNGSDSLFNMLLALHELTYSIVSNEGYIHVIYSSSAVHRKCKNLKESYRFIIDAMVSEANKIGKFESLKYMISRNWYLFQEDIFFDEYDTVDKWYNLFSKYKLLKSRLVDFSTNRNLEKCSLSMAVSRSSWSFLFLFKYSLLILPFYIALMKRIR
ncbi:glycosyltransferase family 2 protein [uncultured Prevotella sp.]|uniref:glycosyltransferase family 2 protein n=1 Tax=uncultured Prevotella sp. TaxID=159272 RepID=UPI0025EFDE75|nr:glycosyltransferase family 2 protein [uncultured Prevotella sp.]